MAAHAEQPDQALARLVQQRRAELQAIVEKIGDIEGDADEHRLVLSTLAEVHSREPQRTCFRLMGNVLVERTVNDVLPALQTTYDGLAKVLAELARQFKEKEAQLQALQKEMK
ncbi:Cochaperone prefoldin complex subunit [Malassezia sp. CBS 17886]|nr:Cochaperone prefoldin complex subunit [Malassezia sp. CBS 17886]